MASVSGIRSLSVEHLLEAVQRLSPDEREEFRRRLTAAHGEIDVPHPDDEALIRVALTRLPAPAERRLRKLIARSEQGTLTPKEVTDYQSLAAEAQRIDAARADALAKLARRRGQLVRAVMATVEREGRANGA